MAFIYDLADTWNASGTTFNGIRLNVTDTASAAGSLLMDLQVGGVSLANVTKAGIVRATGIGPVSGNTMSLATSMAFTGASNLGFDFNIYTGASTVAASRALMGNGFVAASDRTYGFSSTTAANGTLDLILARDAANTLAQRNGVNAQAFNLYGTYTDGSNYRRIKATMSTAGVAEIKPEGAGTGVSGNVLHISGLPTSNPGPGILWNNAGTPAIGT